MKLIPFLLTLYSLMINALTEVLISGMQIACLFFLLTQSADATELDEVYKYVFSNELGYTLVGEKPVSREDFQNLYFVMHPELMEHFILSLKMAFKDSNKFVLKVFDVCDGYSGPCCVNQKNTKSHISSKTHSSYFRI